MEVYPLLTDQQIRDLCAKADNVIITSDNDSHKEIGLKVGLFSQTASITWQMDYNAQKGTLRKAIMDLVMMNKRDEFQQREAAKAARK